MRRPPRRLLLLLLLLPALLACWGREAIEWPVPGVGGRLVVLPVTNATGERLYDWVGAGLTEMIATSLAYTPGLQVVDSARMRDALASRELDAQSPEVRDRVRQLALELGADLVLDVEARRATQAGERGYALDLRLTGRDGRVAAHGELPGADPMAAADEMVAALAEGLAPSAVPVRLTRVYSPSVFLDQLYAMGLHHWRTAGPEDAKVYFELAADAQPDFLAAKARLMDLTRLAGERPASREMAVTLLRSAQARGDARLQVHGLRTLAQVTVDDGRVAEGEQLFGQALKLAQSVGDESLIDAVLEDRVRLAVANGQNEQAEARLREILERRSRLGDRLGELETRIELGSALLARGELDPASEILTAARTLAGELSDPSRETAAAVELGRIAKRRGDAEGAIAEWEKAAAFYEQRGDAENRLRVSRYLAETLVPLGRNKEAEERIQDVLELAHQLGNEDLEARASLYLTRLLLRQGYPLQARHHLDRALELDRHLDPLDLQRVIAWLAYEQENFSLARDTLNVAKRQAGDRWSERDEAFLAAYTEAVAKNQRVPLPFEADGENAGGGDVVDDGGP